MELIHDFLKINDRIRMTRFFAVTLLSYFFLGETVWIEKNILVEKSLLFTGTIFVSLGVIGRAWCLSYISGNKDKILIKTGPYSLCRNPLFFFSLLGALGVGLSTETFTIPLIIIFAFSVYYPSVIKKEESNLRRKFGTEYELYYRRVPRFFPSLRYFVEEEKTLIASKSFRKSITELIFFIILIGFFEFVEGLHRIGWIVPFYTIY